MRLDITTLPCEVSTTPWDSANWRTRPGVARCAGKLALQRREGIDDLGSLEGTISSTDCDLSQNARLDQPLDGLVRRLEGAEAGFRSQIELLTDLLAENGTGVLITLDEIHQNQIGELRELATTVQHAFREERELAFVAAGLSSAIRDVLNDEVLTFLRRADRHHLGVVGREEVERAIREPVEANGRDVADDTLAVMVEGTGGYPFLIQLVGAQVWRLHPADPAISMEDAQRGVSNALRRLGSLIYEPALANASSIDKSFLLAMAKDDGPSRMADIQQRLGVDVNYVSQYRLRLIAAELIESTSRGHVDFAIPYLREYLREHAVSEI
ncbi:MAG: ATP-binding protein [Acidimicrobiales bacterium]